MAASCGHLGDIDAGREALAGFRSLTSSPPAEFIPRALSDPATVQAALEGVAALERGAAGTMAWAEAQRIGEPTQRHADASP